MSYAIYKLFIAGDWVIGDDLSRNIKPLDCGDLLDGYARADAAPGEQAIYAAFEAPKRWATRAAEWRADELAA